jgi:putative ABC transport system permease protein
MLERLAQDIHHAGRTLLRRSGFAGAAILTLALGIGANAAIFSAAYGILLRPLPYDNSERLVLINGRRGVAGASEPVRVFFGLNDLDTFRSRSSFESVAFYATDLGVVSNEGGMEQVDFATVTEAFFSTLRGRFTVGRALSPRDDKTPSIVISERLWRRRFGGSHDVVGQTVTLNSRRGDGTQRAAWRRTPFTIIGVVDDSFQFPTPQTDVWTTVGFVRTVNARCCSFLPVARLKPHATLEQATADATSVAQALSAADVRSYEGLRVSAVGLREQIVQRVQPSLQILMAAVGLVLLVACANVTNLLLARNVARARETAVRLALGASRARLVVQAVVESGLLAMAGCAAGLGLAAGMVYVLRRINPADLPRLDAVHVDAPVLLFACGAAAVVTVITGLVPALQSDTATALSMSGKGVTTRPAGARIRRALMVFELAVSVVLLVGAILLGRSLARLLNTDLGVVTERVATASMNLSLDRELTGAQQAALVDRVIDRVRGLPGVTSAGIGTSLPPRESRILLTLRGQNAIDYQAAAIPVTPGYFPALGIRLLKGRFFTEADDGDHPHVMIMSADTARHFFGDGDPLGQTLSLPVFRDAAQRNATMTLVGVISDVKYSGLDRAADNAVYRPFAQQPWPNVFLVARTASNPAAVTTTLQRQIAGVDRAIAVSAVSTLGDVVLDAATQPRFRTLLLGTLAALALALAAVGLYGVVSYSVSQRNAEIGIRMALGATALDVVGMIVREGFVLAAAGVVIGVAGAYALSRTLEALLYGVAATDPASFIFASAVLFLFSLVASYLPARRATRIDPATALRAE